MFLDACGIGSCSHSNDNTLWIILGSIAVLAILIIVLICLRNKKNK